MVFLAKKDKKEISSQNSISRRYKRCTSSRFYSWLNKEYSYQHVFKKYKHLNKSGIALVLRLIDNFKRIIILLGHFRGPNRHLDPQTPKHLAPWPYFLQTIPPLLHLDPNIPHSKIPNKIAYNPNPHVIPKFQSFSSSGEISPRIEGRG